MVLLITAVELQQLNGIFTETDFIVAQLRQQGFPQVPAQQLASFGFGQGGFDGFGRRRWTIKVRHRGSLADSSDFNLSGAHGNGRCVF